MIRGANEHPAPKRDQDVVGRILRHYDAEINVPFLPDF